MVTAAIAAIQQVCKQFSLGHPTEVQFLPDGLMNRNWRVVTDQGVFAVKQIHDGPLRQARRNLSAVAALHAVGSPVCPPLLTHDGDSVAEHDGHGYSAVRWAPGGHVPGTGLSPAQARQLGETLAGIHQALAALTPDLLDAPPPAVHSKTVSAQAALEQADRFLAAAAAQPAGRSAFDDEVTLWLGQRKQLIEAHPGLAPASEPSGPAGWTHGDVQHRNIIWENGQICAVIDWDKLRVRALGEEIARTATLQFGGEQGWLDLGKVAAFVAGYRSVNPVSSGKLADAVHRLWWKRLTDFWQLEFHYDRGDHSCDHLFFSGERFLHWWTPRREDVMAAFA